MRARARAEEMYTRRMTEPISRRTISKRPEAQRHSSNNDSSNSDSSHTAQRERPRAASARATTAERADTWSDDNEATSARGRQWPMTNMSLHLHNQRTGLRHADHRRREPQSRHGRAASERRGGGEVESERRARARCKTGWQRRDGSDANDGGDDGPQSTVGVPSRVTVRVRNGTAGEHTRSGAERAGN
jgi:hypothetical protein